MKIAIMLLVNLLGFTLLCMTQKKHRQQAAAYFGPRMLAALRIAGYVLTVIGAALLVRLYPGNTGLILWFGLHPLLIMITSVLTAYYFRALMAFFMGSLIFTIVLSFAH